VKQAGAAALLQMLEENTAILKLVFDDGVAPSTLSNAEFEALVQRRLADNAAQRHVIVPMLLNGQVHLAGEEISDELKYLIVSLL